MSDIDKVKGIVLLVVGGALGLIAVYLILEELIENRAIIYVFMLGTAMLFLYLGKKYWKKGKRKKK